MWANLVLAVLRLIVSIVNALRDQSLRVQGYQQANAEQQAKNAAVLDKMASNRDTAIRNFDATAGVPDTTDPNLRD